MRVEPLFLSDDRGASTFAVELDVFSGPFSVLLSLIAKKKLDVTEVALAAVTDEFIAYVSSLREYDLSVVSEFLVVGATLLDIKLAHLLPHETRDEEEFEYIEQRDLLFARLLQYRAFKEVAADFGRRLEAQSLRVARAVPLEEQYARALPEVRLPIGIEDLALLAVAASRNKEEPLLPIAQLHDPLVSVSSQVQYVRDHIGARPRTFADLCADAPNRATVVSRFMAILEMMRHGEIMVTQEQPLGPLLIGLTVQGGESCGQC
ncbi:MAG: segregation/condensation protein A [Ancrocorticia sp.]|jgi:segregation and condensation protein A|nr:segregation/condensation protein A [Ancrocorticia sp.]MCI1895497.1 segregation/condensation protein A [Ancrocorticia sp.]MCI1932170.1 segregation/condensation protein A [Ancrocorticia sp.]MCI1963530.1 segregation/condensation protein A [Ancrocorticia sp.]MCI2002276.1 segregation/condensation protein A [Ancrocorticia sp.]